MMQNTGWNRKYLVASESDLSVNPNVVIVVGNIVAIWHKELRGQHYEHDIQAMVPFHPAVVQSF